MKLNTIFILNKDKSIIHKFILDVNEVNPFKKRLKELFHQYKMDFKIKVEELDTDFYSSHESAISKFKELFNLKLTDRIDKLISITKLIPIENLPKIDTKKIKAAIRNICKEHNIELDTLQIKSNEVKIISNLLKEFLNK